MKSKSQLSSLILWGAGVTSLAITPFSFDPVNASKFATLCIFGFAIISVLLSDSEFRSNIENRNILIVSLLFVFVGLLAVTVTRNNLTQQIFGTAGRQTGYLTYVALVCFMLGSVKAASKLHVENLLKILLLVGSISLFYGLIQTLNLDPLDWTNPLSPVIGFLGNSNFQSSFMALTAVSAIATLLKSKTAIFLRISFSVYVLLAIFLIYKSNSQQGFLVFAAGLSVIFLFWVKVRSRTFLAPTAYLSFVFISTIFVVLDILQKAPWSSILYKESVSNRGDMWRAGWQMTLDHPMFGIGFDNYGDWYRRSRDLESLSRGVDTISNTSHNVFLDISTSGGFPLLIAYLFIIGITLRASIRILRRSTEFNAPIVGIIGAWVAYLVQSLISINQIGLAIWGWILSGTIIGFEIHTRINNESSIKKTKEKLGAMVIGVFLGMIIGFPPLISDLVYRNAIDSREIAAVENAAFQWPQNGDRMIQVAATFRENELNEQALKIARAATKFAPNRYEAWQVLASIPNLPQSEYLQAIAKMRELDPLNPSLNKS
jgi:O-antigen ligase